MARGLNKVMLIGLLGKAPDVRTLTSGSFVSNFSIAVDDSYKKNGEYVKQTEWINITVFGKLAEIVAEYLKKGSKVYVEGRFKTQKYTNSNDATVYKSYVQADTLLILSSKPVSDQDGRKAYDDEDIPF